MNDNRSNRTRLSQVSLIGLGSLLALGMAACKSNPASAPIVGTTSAPAGDDPAAGNMAPPYTGGNAGGYTSASPATSNTRSSGTRVLGQTQSFAGQSDGENYGSDYGDTQGEAPIIRQAPEGSPGYYNANGQGYSDAEEAGAQAIAETDQAPPPLPEYDQPPAPEQNDLWTPGYWNYAQTGYYWVPGAWCAPPFYGALWTPSWWGYSGGHYLYHRGYWGHHVGYYGGINYGYGYIGHGYEGGYWRDRDFVYNRAVTNVNVNVIHNVYNREVVYDGRQYGPRPDSRVSYNGGRGGINAQPLPGELAAAREPHYAPVPAQRDLRLAAASNHSQFFAANGGRPAQAFATRPVGSPTNVAAAPREQPFNRAGTAPAGNTRPGQTPFNGGRPGVENNRSGAAGNLNQPNRAGGAPAGQPGFNGGQPAATGPGNNARFNHQFPAGSPGAVQPGRPAPNAAPPLRPANPQPTPGAANTPRPGFEGARQQPPQQQQRPAPQVGQQQRPVPQIQQQQQRPAPQPQQQQQRPAPQFQQQQRPAPQVQPQQRPAPQVQPQYAPRPQAAPAPAQRPAPAPRPSAPAPAPRPAPAAAPHAGGGEDHGHR